MLYSKLFVKVKNESGVNFHVIERVKGVQEAKGHPETCLCPQKLESEVIMRIKIFEDSWKLTEGVRTSTEGELDLKQSHLRGSAYTGAIKFNLSSSLRKSK